jgi:hypothetical protein
MDMKISHFIPENPPYEGIFCSFQALVMPVKPLVGSSSLPTLILVLKGMVQGEWGGQVLEIRSSGFKCQRGEPTMVVTWRFQLRKKYSPHFDNKPKDHAMSFILV